MISFDQTRTIFLYIHRWTKKAPAFCKDYGSQLCIFWFVLVFALLAKGYWRQRVLSAKKIRLRKDVLL